MKTIILKTFASILIVFFAVISSYGQTDIGSYNNSFVFKGNVASGEALIFTTCQPMNITIHNYSMTRESSVDGSSSITLSEASSGNIIKYQEKSAFRTFVYDADKACMILNELPAGTYEVLFEGESGSIPVFIQGYCSSGAYSHAGEDISLAIDLGSFDDDFSYSHLRDTDNTSYWSTYGFPSKDVFYKFTLNDAMYLVINHWGSPVAETLFNVSTNLYILSYVDNILQEVAAAGTLGTDGEIDDIECVVDLEAPYDMIPEIEDFNNLAAAWHGWLDPGTYYVVSESPYYGGNMSYTQEGLLLTNIRGFSDPYIEIRKPINIGQSNDGLLTFEDCKYFSAERYDELMYRFTLDVPATLQMFTTAPDYMLERGEEYVEPTLITIDGITEYEGLSAGDYLLYVSSFESDFLITSISSIPYSIPLEPDGPSEPQGPALPDLDYCIGDIEDNFCFNDWMLLPEHSDTSLNFKFRIKDTCAVIFDYNGSESTGFSVTIRDSLSSQPLYSRTIINETPAKFHLSLCPGAYYHQIETEDSSSKIYMSLRVMEDIAKERPKSNFTYSKNNIVTYLPFLERTDVANSQNSRIKIEYFDGLGRPLQMVRFCESPFGQDLADYIQYEYGRPIKKFLPIVDGNAGAFKTLDQCINELVYDYAADSGGYAVAEYETSLTGRVVSETGPGMAWHDSSRKNAYNYIVNDNSDNAFCLKYTISGPYDQINVPTCCGRYLPGDLSVTKTISEDNVISYTFTDKKGRLVMARTINGDESEDTYYVYDVRNQLRAVITPEAVRLAGTNGDLSQSLFYNLCFGYGYDDRGNKVVEKSPGISESKTIFNQQGYPLFHQSPKQALSGEWSYNIPDIYGRVALKGVTESDEQCLREIAGMDVYAVLDPLCPNQGFYSIDNHSFVESELHEVFYYDDYDFLQGYQSRGQVLEFAQCFSPDNRRESCGVTCRGMLTGRLSKNIDDGNMLLSVIYYDKLGNVTQIQNENTMGGRSVMTYNHDFLGNVLIEKEYNEIPGVLETYLTHTHSYDKAGRLISTVTELDGKEVVTKNTYDPIGRLEMTVVTNGEVSDTTMHTYNVRGWQTSVENDHWSAVMRYNNPIHSGSIASFTGNISEWEWSRGDETNAYSLSYDVLSRVTDSRLFRNGTLTRALAESGISYDSNGNILSLNRTGEDGSTVNDLVYNYDGNKLARLSDNGSLSQIYAYDADGNMTFDGRTGMSLDWNNLGLVEKVSLGDTVLVNYTYLADGTKVSALDDDGNGLLYLGSLIYRKQGETISLESAAFAGGRFVAKETADGSIMVPMFHVTDHLGSVRVVVDGVSGEVVETNDYYPFGSRWNTTASLTDNTNRFRYNSKEEQFKFGTPYIDYGARQYDPILGRWFAQDPLSEKYYSISPYAFCAGNPVKYLDPDGEIIGTAIDVASVAIGIGSFIKNVRSGNVKEAAGDAIGVAVDVIAAAVPFIPGGVGIVRNGAKTAKVINALDNAADVAKTAENVADVGTDAVKAADELTLGGSKKSIVISPENQVDRNLLEKPAKRGNAFIFKDDKTPVEIHHVGQNNNGPYKEMHRSNHRGKDNYKKNHPQSNEKSRINREEFAKQKRDYWQNEYDKYYNY